MAEEEVVQALVRAMELRDRETARHTQRVVALSERLAREVGIAEYQIIHVRRGAALHDIGKLGVPESILHKPGPLTVEEWNTMRQHPSYAADLLRPFVALQPAMELAYCHHELWDGTGYPRGLQGEEIPLAARVLAIVEVWDALRSDLPYRAAWPKEKAIQHFRDQSGRAFDPQITQIFLRIVTSEEV